MAEQKRDPITERFLDEEQEGRQSIIDAANQGFIEDQEDPDSPTRRKRRLVKERHIEDPAHSKGSDRHRT